MIILRSKEEILSSVKGKIHDDHPHSMEGKLVREPLTVEEQISLRKLEVFIDIRDIIKEK